MINYFIQIIKAILNILRRLFGLKPPPSNRRPNVVILGPTSDVTGTSVLIEYNLIDAESDPIRINASYSIDDGNLQVATPLVQDPRHQGVSGLSASPFGELHRFVWDWQSDIQDSQITGVIIHLQAADQNGNGPSASSSTISIRTQPPVP